MTGETDHLDWANLGRAVQARRTQLGFTQGAVQAAGGPSVATMVLIEAGKQTSYKPRTLVQLERALQWRDGSIEAVLSGGKPTPRRIPGFRPLQPIDEEPDLTDVSDETLLGELARRLERAGATVAGDRGVGKTALALAADEQLDEPVGERARREQDEAAERGDG